jgi:hypothetical protein
MTEEGAKLSKYYLKAGKPLLTNSYAGSSSDG